ncbi:MAG: hypothetical protein HOP13_05705 [Alphaproteobacteria bacterium]|nr:hypothetical protein [Alphaproteobacteria bacterium]
MRRIVLLMMISLFLAQSAPVSTQPFGPPQPPILNGCSENALFAILNSDRGRYCLDTMLPRQANIASDYSVFCSAGRWGCCIKSVGLGGCKVEGVIPTYRRPKPPAMRD